MLDFKPPFSLSSFTFIKRLFSSSLLSALRVVSSSYLRLLIFLLAILIPACAPSCPAFLMMYSACKFNNQGDNIQPCCTPFPIWNQSVGPCPVVTVASWPIIWVSQDAGQVVWYAHLFQNFPQFIVIHTFEGFGLVNKAEMFFWNSLAFSMIQWMLAIWSLVPLPFLKPAWTSSLKSVRNCYAIFLRWNAASISCSLTHSVPFVHFQFLRNTHKSCSYIRRQCRKLLKLPGSLDPLCMHE